MKEGLKKTDGGQGDWFELGRGLAWNYQPTLAVAPNATAKVVLPVVNLKKKRSRIATILVSPMVSGCRNG
jgi:hypothetical protein